MHLRHRRNSPSRLPPNFGAYGILSLLTAVIRTRDIAFTLNEDNECGRLERVVMVDVPAVGEPLADVQDGR
jgi:hypothetical protein